MNFQCSLKKKNTAYHLIGSVVLRHVNVLPPPPCQVHSSQEIQYPLPPTGEHWDLVWLLNWPMTAGPGDGHALGGSLDQVPQDFTQICSQIIYESRSLTQHFTIFICPSGQMANLLVWGKSLVMLGEEAACLACSFEDWHIPLKGSWKRCSCPDTQAGAKGHSRPQGDLCGVFPT